MFRVDRARPSFVRREPGQDERHPLAFRDREIRHRGEIFATGFHRRSQDQGVRAGDRFQCAVALAHPRNNFSVIETDDQLHLHPHLAPHAFDDANDIGIFSPWRHEIDQAHHAFGRFYFRLENQRISAITAARRRYFSLRPKAPAPVPAIAE
jgi:hypothetical protein